ncbi:unnamed protein product [Rhizophagus irregularis]|nr:unnamed protein product [Rhizophagus irregularis]
MFNATEVFWESFEHSLSLNKRGANGKQRILSIIADKFPYKELQTKLHVSSHTIHNAKIHGRIFGHGCPAAPKPPMRKKIMPQEHEDQFEWFMSSKENDLANLIIQNIENQELQVLFRPIFVSIIINIQN